MVSYLFIVDSSVPITDLPEYIQSQTDYIFRTLTDEHITKILLLQKMKSATATPTPIFICWDASIELDDLRESIHPKLYAILRYTADSYGIFHRKIEELTATDIECLREQKKYAS